MPFSPISRMVVARIASIRSRLRSCLGLRRGSVAFRLVSLIHQISRESCEFAVDKKHDQVSVLSNADNLSVFDMGCKRGQPVTVTDATQAENGDWLVGNPTGPQLASALWIGSVGLLILGLQPVLLGALYTEGHVTGDELALVATAEMIAIAIGSGVAAVP